jgi:predicted alpha-1,6-mannanase (GH76 family)
METTHSKTRRTKSTSPKIVVESWDSVWDSFKGGATKTTVEAMNAEGWKTESQAAQETGISRQRINTLANSGKMDKIKKRVFLSGLTREINFVRPKVQA